MGCFFSSPSELSGPLPPSLQAPSAGKMNRLYVLIAHFNPKQFATRKRLLQECVSRLMRHRAFFQSAEAARYNLELIPAVVEVVYGDGVRDFTDVPSGCNYIMRTLPSKNLMWSKEQLLNLAIEHAPNDSFIAWIDGDLEFPDPLWAVWAVKAMQSTENAFVQLFQQAKLLNSKNVPFSTVQSFAFQYSKGKTYSAVANSDTENYWHPGFAWAARKSTLKKVGCLLDRTLGSADLHMACALIDRIEETIPIGVTDGYKALILDWHTSCKANGLMLVCTEDPRPIRHHWHGAMKNRQYVERWQIVIQNKFDPLRDCTFREDLGLYVYAETADEKMVNDLNDFFSKRQEDSEDMDDKQPSQHSGSDSIYHESGRKTQTARRQDHNHHESKPSYWGGYA